MTQSTRIWALPTALVCILTAVPLLATIGAFFVPDNAWEHIRQTVLWSYVGNSLLLMLLVGLLAGVLGTLSAWLVAATTFPGRRALKWMLVLPLAAPAYVVAYVYTDLLETSGPLQSWLRSSFDLQQGAYWFPSVRTLTGAAVLLALVLYPYVYLLARAGFASRMGSTFEAARMLGASPARAFWRVALPGIRPAIAGGLALVLMETLADFGVVAYFSVPTFSTGIFRTWIGMGDKAAALKLAGTMLIFVAALVAVESASRRGRHHGSGTASAAGDRIKLRGWGAVGATIFCVCPVLFGFVVPTCVLTWMALTQGDTLLARTFTTYAANSVSVAAVAALVATAVAVLLAYTSRLHPRPAIHASVRFATLGYALPGMLLAVGLLGPMGWLDQLLTRWMAQNFAWSGGLILSGSLVLLVYAYVVRFLTVAFNSVSAGFAAVPPGLDDAARSLGSSPGRVVRRVHLPLLRRSIGVAGLLVFVDVMRELPATLILRPFDFETLATRVYRLASDERLTEASTAALAIVLVGIIPVLLINRSQAD